MRLPVRFLSLCAGALSLFLLGSAPARAFEPGVRVFDSAAAAVLGGIVAGPVGLVAGAVIGYTLGPTLTGVTLGGRRRVARRRVHRPPPPVASAEPQYYQPQAYAAPQGYAQPAQPMYMAQVPPPGGAAYPPAPSAPAPQVTAPGAAGAPQQPYPQAAMPPVRTTVYAPVPMPAPMAPSGNYAAHAYQPQDGQTPDPLH